MHFLFIFPTGSGFQVSSTDPPSRTAVPALLPNESVPIYWFIAPGVFAAALAQPATDKATGTGSNLSPSARRSCPPSLLLDPTDSSCLQKIQHSQQGFNPQLSRVTQTNSGHREGRKQGRDPQNSGWDPAKCSPRASQSPGAGKPGCLKRLKSLAISSSLPGGCNVSWQLMQDLYLQKKKPEKFTVCCWVPNKDGKQALWAEQWFEPRYHFFPTCEPPHSWLQIQGLPLKAESTFEQQKEGTHLKEFSPNSERVVLLYFRPALSQL